MRVVWVRVPVAPPRGKIASYLATRQGSAAGPWQKTGDPVRGDAHNKYRTHIWRGKHNWHCSGLENRSRATVCGFESHPLRQYAADHRQVIGYPWVLVGCDPQDIETVLCPDSLAGKAFD